MKYIGENGGRNQPTGDLCILQTSFLYSSKVRSSADQIYSIRTIEVLEIYCVVFM